MSWRGFRDYSQRRCHNFRFLCDGFPGDVRRSVEIEIRGMAMSTRTASCGIALVPALEIVCSSEDGRLRQSYVLTRDAPRVSLQGFALTL